VILNGCLPGDEEDNYTYIAHNGSSVIEFFFALRCFVHLGTRLAVIPNIESKHMPVELELELVGKNDVSVEQQRKVKIQSTYGMRIRHKIITFLFIYFFVFLRKKYLRFLYRPLNLLMMMLKLLSMCLTVLSNSQATV